MAIFKIARRARKLRYYVLWRCYTLGLWEISRRTRWWCLKCVKVYPLRDIRPFVMYCVNGKPCSSLLIESTDSMIYTHRESLVHNHEPRAKALGNYYTEPGSIIIRCIKLYRLINTPTSFMSIQLRTCAPRVNKCQSYTM